MFELLGLAAVCLGANALLCSNSKDPKSQEVKKNVDNRITGKMAGEIAKEISKAIFK